MWFCEARRDAGISWTCSHSRHERRCKWCCRLVGNVLRNARSSWPRRWASKFTPEEKWWSLWFIRLRQAPVSCFLFCHLQLGVSSVDELRQILGTDVEDTQKKRGRLSNDKSDSTIKDLKDDAPTDEIVYKDSSTFLKVFTGTLYILILRCIYRYSLKYTLCIGNAIVESAQWLLSTFHRHWPTATEFYQRCGSGGQIWGVPKTARADQAKGRSNRRDCNSTNVSKNRPAVV